MVEEVKNRELWSRRLSCNDDSNFLFYLQLETSTETWLCHKWLKQLSEVILGTDSPQYSLPCVLC